MKHASLRLAALLTFSMLVGSAAHAQSPQNPPSPDANPAAASRPLLTVLDFSTDRTGWAPPPKFGATLADVLATQLVESGQYRVLDREWLLTPADDGRQLSPEVMRARAQQSGVEYLVVGSMTRYTIEQRRRGALAFGIPIAAGGGSKKTETVVGLTVRVVDTRTGDLITSLASEANASRKNLLVGAVGLLHLPIPVGFGSSSSAPREALLSEAMQSAVLRLGEGLTRAAAKLTHWSGR